MEKADEKPLMRSNQNTQVNNRFRSYSQNLITNKRIHKSEINEFVIIIKIMMMGNAFAVISLLQLFIVSFCNGEPIPDNELSSVLHVQETLTRALSDSSLRGTIFINEVASSPTPTYGYCSDNDWVELINLGNGIVNLAGFVLLDERGPTSNESFTFPYYSSIYPGQIYLVCGTNSTYTNSYNFRFNIDGNDTITLLDSSGDFIATTGVLPNGGNATSTYQRTTNNTYMYGRPSPYFENFPSYAGSIFINEVASSPTPNYGYCSGNEWIELINVGNKTIDLVGLVLHDDQGQTNNESFTFRSFSSISPGQFYVVCGQPSNSTYPNAYSFRFNIDGNDTITLLDLDGVVISTTGVLQNGGNATSTYQRTTNNTYMYGRPTPYRENFPVFVGSIFINEVASSPTVNGYCYGNDWIELFNAGNNSVDLTGLVLHDDRGPTYNESFTFMSYSSIYPGQFYVICGQPSNSIYPYSNAFRFNIDGNDTITLLDFNWNVISSTGVLPSKGSATSTYQRTINNTFAYGYPSPNQANFPTFRGSIHINEVASSPTPSYGYCDGSDWIELINAGNDTVDLAGLVLHDDRGPANNESFTFTSYSSMYPGQFYIVCGQSLNSTYQNSYNFRFNIDGSDTITLLDFNGNVLSTTGVLPNNGNATLTYQRTINNNYMYGSPTPGRENFIVIPPNDDCINAIVVDPLSGELLYGDTTNALYDYTYNCGNSYGRGLWYKITNPNQTPLILSATTCHDETILDTHISVLKGENCNYLSCVGSNDDAVECGSASKVKFTAASRSTYYIYVAGFDSSVGRFTLTIDVITRAPIPVPVPSPVSVPIMTPIAPVRAPVSAPILAPVSAPIQLIAPVPVPILVPTISTKNDTTTVPVKAPTSNQVPTTVPTKKPTGPNTNCGLFGFNFFCPRPGKCGFWRRLLNIRGC